MKCAKCGRDAHAATTTEAYEMHDNRLLVVRHIPCYRCEYCGEIMYTGDVAAKLQSLTAADRDKPAAEITVLRYAAHNLSA